MGEMKDRAKGAMDETIGKAKRAAGKAMDDPEMEAKGIMQEAKGDVETAIGKAKGALKR